MPLFANQPNEVGKVICSIIEHDHDGCGCHSFIIMPHMQDTFLSEAAKTRKQEIETALEICYNAEVTTVLRLNNSKRGISTYPMNSKGRNVDLRADNILITCTGSDDAAGVCILQAKPKPIRN